LTSRLKSSSSTVTSTLISSSLSLLRYPIRMDSKAATSPEFDRFDQLVGKVLSVSKAEVQRRIEEDKRETKRETKVKDGERTA
jgi:hypothetical protein